MKTIAQLLQLSKNPRYTLTEQEQAVLNAFLSHSSAEQISVEMNLTDSFSRTPAIVRTKNIVKKETGQLPEETV